MNFKKTIYLTLSFFALMPAMLVAQSPKQQNAWLKEVLDYKHKFLVEEMGLTKAQEEQFMPLYIEMEQEIMQANKEAREFEAKVSNSKENVSELEYRKAAEALSEVKTQEAQIEATYFQKFSKFLSKKQLFLLKRAETKFSRNMISHSKRKTAKK